MKSIINKTGWIALVLITLLLSGHLYYFITGDFRTSYLLESQETGEFVEQFNKPDKDHQILKKILGQQYFYLRHGNQIYAFVSDDDKYVLKLFKKDFFLRTRWVHVLPPISSFRALYLYSGEGKEKRKKKLLNGYTTGFVYDRENCGLLYFHPYSELYSGLETILVTGLGNKLPIDLNQYVFAIQVKANTTKKELSKLLSQGKVSEANLRIQQLYDLYFSGYNNDIFDHDHNLIDNTGFYGGRAIRQDVGKVVRDPHLITYTSVKKDLKKITDDRLGPWLQKNYPQYAPELIREMKDRVATGLKTFPKEL